MGLYSLRSNHSTNDRTHAVTHTKFVARLKCRNEQILYDGTTFSIMLEEQKIDLIF